MRRGRPAFRPRDSSRPGLTLIELLAVAALLGLLATLTMGVMGPLASAQRRLLAESTLRETVQRARLAASLQGGCVLVLGEAPRVVYARTPSSGQPTPMAMPRGWSARVADFIPARSAASPSGSASGGEVVFGPDGVTGDAEVALLGPRGERIALRIRGMSGTVERVEWVERAELLVGAAP